MKDTQVFAKYASYYELLNQGKDYAAEVKYVLSLVERLGGSVDKLLDLGCGTGMHAVEFRKLGLKVVGIERSAEMSALARDKGIECITADLKDFSVSGQFPLAVSLFHVFSYLAHPLQLFHTLVNIRSHLSADGLLVFDVWHKQAVLQKRPEVRRRKVSTSGVSVVRNAMPRLDVLNNLVHINFDFAVEKDDALVESWQEVHTMRYYDEEEIKSAAIAAGYRVLSSEAYLTGETPSADTWGVCYVLQRTEMP